jgi:hypothetical protein
MNSLFASGRNSLKEKTLYENDEKSPEEAIFNNFFSSETLCESCGDYRTR